MWAGNIMREYNMADMAGLMIDFRYFFGAVILYEF